MSNGTADNGALSPMPASEDFGDAEVRDLIAEYPLAWIVPKSGGGEAPSLLPLLAETDADGRLTALVGHMGRRNPLRAALEAEPRALVLFNGPQGYVSPGLVSDPAWAPTWNYAQLRIAATFRFEAEKTGEALDRLIAAMDHTERTGWTPALMGPRYERLSRAIIGFRAEVTEVGGRFKLGAEERIELLREILEGHPNADLVRWMRRQNADRL